MDATKETRLESFLLRPAAKRKNDILKALDAKQMTARMIAEELGFSDLNAVKPRLTELKADGKVQIIGKAYDMATKRNVAVYERIGG